MHRQHDRHCAGGSWCELCRGSHWSTRFYRHGDDAVGVHSPDQAENSFIRWRGWCSGNLPGVLVMTLVAIVGLGPIGLRSRVLPRFIRRTGSNRVIGLRAPSLTELCVLRT